VVFQLAREDKRTLDKMEGLGKGCDEKTIEVTLSPSGTWVTAVAYIADASIDDGLKPWMATETSSSPVPRSIAFRRTTSSVTSARSPRFRGRPMRQGGLGSGGIPDDLLSLHHGTQC
jgi:hypothetical protein